MLQMAELGVVLVGVLGWVWGTGNRLVSSKAHQALAVTPTLPVTQISRDKHGETDAIVGCASFHLARERCVHEYVSVSEGEGSGINSTIICDKPFD